MDRISLRIVGVLLEKELATPEIYPLTEKALLAGCNQKSNRDPEMGIEVDELRSAMLSLYGEGLVGKVDGQGRVSKFKHRFDERFRMATPARAVLSELICRGPQSPGALQRRIERMGVRIEPDAVLDELDALRQQSLVEKLPRQPRERDWRWGQTMGESGDAWMGSASDATASASTATRPLPDAPAGGSAPAPATDAPAGEPADLECAPNPDREDLRDRVASLEAEVARLRGMLERGLQDGGKLS